MLTFGEAAGVVEGRWLGDGQSIAERHVLRLAPIEEAQPGELSFITQSRLLPRLASTQASGVLISKRLLPAIASTPSCHVLVVEDANFAAATLQQLLVADCADVTRPGISPHAMVEDGCDIHPSVRIGPGAVVVQGAKIGPDCQLGPQTFVGANAHMGARCRMHPGAKLMWGCTLGDDVILQAGAIVGSDGFGYAEVPGLPSRIKMPQSGRVVIENDVEIGANTTVDRATFGVTRIGHGTKIDNLVQVGHNVTIGEHSVIVSQSGVAGSTTLGARVIVGAQVGIVGHIQIADGVILAARAGVMGTIDERGVYAGTPAIPHRQWLRAMIAVKKLPEWIQRWRRSSPLTDKPQTRPS